MMTSLFIAGTDTHVGKTYITSLIAAQLTPHFPRLITQKWIQTGCTHFSDDLLAHLSAMKKSKSDFSDFLPAMCPYSFPLAASPHLAAQHNNTPIDPAYITSCYHHLCASFDWVIIEGSGGLLVPYSSSHTLLDLVVDLDLSVILVAENKLGCINHTLLSLSVLQHHQINCLGIVLNRIPSSHFLPDTRLDSRFETKFETNDIICRDNLSFLRAYCDVPVIPNSDLDPFITELFSLETVGK